MKINILVDDKAKKRGFLAEHGLSIFIENKNTNILFDTGQSDVYAKNAKKMQVDLGKADYMIISHGHYDHCGGLEFFSGRYKLPPIYIQKAALNEKYVQNQDKVSYREAGMPFSMEDNKRVQSSLNILDGNFQIDEKTHLFSKIPFCVDFEEKPQNFSYADKGEVKPDYMEDEQMLVIDTPKGLVAFLGCSHRGIINCLEYALSQLKGKSLHTVVAGMHLEGISPKRLEKTMQALYKMGIERLVPLHCTGIEAICEINKFFKDKCTVLYSGDSLEI